MKLGDLVTVSPYRKNLYLIVGDLPEQEINWNTTGSGEPLGRLWKLYDSSDHEIKSMYEKFIEVIK